MVARTEYLYILIRPILHTPPGRASPVGALSPTPVYLTSVLPEETQRPYTTLARRSFRRTCKGVREVNKRERVKENRKRESKQSRQRSSPAVS